MLRLGLVANSVGNRMFLNWQAAVSEAYELRGGYDEAIEDEQQDKDAKPRNRRDAAVKSARGADGPSAGKLMRKDYEKELAEAA